MERQIGAVTVMAESSETERRLRRLEESVEAFSGQLASVDHKAGEFERYRKRGMRRGLYALAICIVAVAVAYLVMPRTDVFIKEPPLAGRKGLPLPPPAPALD